MLVFSWLIVFRTLVSGGIFISVINGGHVRRSRDMGGGGGGEGDLFVFVSCCFLRSILLFSVCGLVVALRF